MSAKPRITPPGDIDGIVRENGQNVAYEVKNIDYTNWQGYRQKFGDQNAGLSSLVNSGQPIYNGGPTIQDYKFMFRGEPPQDMQDWLNSKNIPWEYYNPP